MIYRFMIVDDEYYVRQHIHHCIDWKELGFQFAGEAGSASAALEFLENNPVELMLLDISMPGQSGMDLLKALPHEKKPHTIILTGFATFDYAKTAISCGVDNYLLKPVNPDELTSAVKKIKERLDEENMLQKERQELLYHNQLMEKNTRNKFFRDLFAGCVPENSEAVLHKYHITPDCSYYILILDVYSDFFASPAYEQKQAWRKAMENTAIHVISDKDFCILIQDSYNRAAVILNSSSNSFSITQIIQNIRTMVSENFQLRLLSGYSVCEKGTAEKLCRCYHKAVEFFQFRSIYSEDLSLLQTKLPAADFLDFINAKNSQVKAHLINRQKSEIREDLQKIFRTMAGNLFSLQALESELFTLMGIAIHYCAAKKLDILETEEASVSYNCSEMIRSGLPCSQMEQKFCLLFESLIDSSMDEEGQFIENLVLQAMEIIKKNYSRDDLGLNSIAAELLISPSYLSRNFTKIHGSSLTSYLTCCRLENARNLLSDTNLSIAEVSERSGYRDLFYFSKRFKNFFGVSPSKYRAEVQGKQQENRKDKK